MGYSEEEKQNIAEMFQKKYSYTDIAKAIGSTHEAVRGIIRRMRKNKEILNKRPEVFKPVNMDCLVDTTLDLFSGPELKREREVLQARFNDGRAKRILNISDLHIPFHNSKLLKTVLQEKADICVVSGDMLDCYSVSTFKKDKLIPLSREIKEGTEIIRILSELYPEVVVSTANHEKRLLRLLQNKFYDVPEMVELLKENTNVLGKISTKHKNVQVINNWWFGIGKCMFMHPDFYSAGRSKTAQNAYEFLTSVNEPFDSVIVAHTHHFSKIIYFGKLLVENPCLCHQMDYIIDGHRKNAEWHFGYTIVNLDKEGNTNYNTTNPIYLK